MLQKGAEIWAEIPTSPVTATLLVTESFAFENRLGQALPFLVLV